MQRFEETGIHERSLEAKEWTGRRQEGQQLQQRRQKKEGWSWRWHCRPQEQQKEEDGDESEEEVATTTKPTLRCPRFKPEPLCSYLAVREECSPCKNLGAPGPPRQRGSRLHCFVEFQEGVGGGRVGSILLWNFRRGEGVGSILLWNPLAAHDAK